MKVVNIRAVEAALKAEGKSPSAWRTNPQFVYIGRAGKGLPGTYGNPHDVGLCRTCSHEGKDVVHSRDEAIAAYRGEMRGFILQHRKELEGKTLVCFCAPQACHGDVIVEWLMGKQEALF